jgi:hypothetical protein
MIYLTELFKDVPHDMPYAVVRGKDFLGENKEVEEGMTQYLKNLTTSP